MLYWYDPMVPDQRFDEPGKSPFMDMQLVPKCAGGDAQGAGGVSIDSTLVQNFGIRTAEAEYGVLEPEISVTGTLAYNGSEMAIVQPRAGGYVQRTYGHAPQDLIARGAPIVDILVPEWGGAQNEYLAVAATGDEALTRAARERLRLLGMPDSMIASVTIMPCGPPKPRKAVLGGVCVLHTTPRQRRLGHLYTLSMWRMARSITGPERSSIAPPLE